jgi:hypothetical protein
MISENRLIELLEARLKDPKRRTDSSKNVKTKKYPPASLAAVRQAEADLGFELVPFHKRLYLEVANGGFGPGFGILGVKGGFRDDEYGTLVDCYRRFASMYREDRIEWPQGLLPIIDWGDFIWSCLDCIVGNNGLICTLHEKGLNRTSHNLMSWLASWIEGVPLMDEIFEMGTIKRPNPFKPGQMFSVRFARKPKGEYDPRLKHD